MKGLAIFWILCLSAGTLPSTQGFNFQDALRGVVNAVNTTAQNVRNVLTGTLSGTVLPANITDPCSNSTTREERLDCYWQTFASQRNSSEFQKFISTFSNSTTTTASWSSDQLRRGFETLKAFIATCRNDNSSNCTAGPLSAPAALIERAQLVLRNCSNHTWDGQTANQLRNIFENYVNRAASLNFRDLIASRVRVLNETVNVTGILGRLQNAVSGFTSQSTNLTRTVLQQVGNSFANLTNLGSANGTLSNTINQARTAVTNLANSITSRLRLRRFQNAIETAPAATAKLSQEIRSVAPPVAGGTRVAAADKLLSAFGGTVSGSTTVRGSLPTLNQTLSGRTTSGPGTRDGICATLLPQRRARCVMNRLLSGSQESTTVLLQIAGVMKNFMNTSVPLLNMTSQEMMSGFVAMNATVAAYRASKAAGGPVIQNATDLLRSDLLATARLDLQAKNLTLNETALRMVIMSLDAILRATPAADLHDPTSSLVALIEATPPARSRQTSMRFTGEVWSSNFTNLSHPQTQALIQRTAANIAEALRQFGGILLSFVATSVSNGSAIVQGQVIYESGDTSTDAAGPTGDPFEAMINETRQSGRLGSMTVDPANITASAFIPCTNASRKPEKVRCLMEQFNTRDNLADLRNLAASVGPDTARTQLANWDANKFKASIDTLKNSIRACRLLAVTSGSQCQPTSFLTDPKVANETAQIARFRNGTVDAAGAAVIQSVLENFIRSIDSTMTFADILSNQKPANRTTVNMRFEGNFTNALANSSSPEFKAQEAAIMTQLSSAISANGGEVMRMRVVKFTEGSIRAEIEVVYGNTSVTVATVDPLRAALAGAIRARLLGNLIVLAAANGTIAGALGLNQTGLVNCANITNNQTARIGCFWSLMSNQTNVTALQSLIRTLGNDTLRAATSSWTTDQMTRGMDSLRMFILACRDGNNATVMNNCTAGPLNASQEIIDRAKRLLSNLTRSTWDPNTAQTLRGIFETMASNASGSQPKISFKDMLQTNIPLLNNTINVTAILGRISGTLDVFVNRSSTLLNTIQNRIGSVLGSNIPLPRTGARGPSQFAESVEPGMAKAGAGANATRGSPPPSGGSFSAFDRIRETNQRQTRNFAAAASMATQGMSAIKQDIQSASPRQRKAVVANKLMESFDVILGGSSGISANPTSEPEPSVTEFNRNALADALNCSGLFEARLSQCVVSGILSFRENLEEFRTLLQSSAPTDGNASVVLNYSDTQLDAAFDSFRLLTNAQKALRGAGAPSLTKIGDALSATRVATANSLASNEGNSTFNATILRPFILALDKALFKSESINGAPFIAILNRVPPAWPREGEFRLNLTYSKALEDPNSIEYQELVTEFRKSAEEILGYAQGSLIALNINGLKPGSIVLNATLIYESWSAGADALTTAMRNLSTTGTTTFGSLPFDIDRTKIDAPTLCTTAAQNASMLNLCAISNFQVMFLEEPENLRTRGAVLLNGTDSFRTLSAMTDVQLREAAASFRALLLARRMEGERSQNSFSNVTQFQSDASRAKAAEILNSTNGTFSPTGADVIMQVLDQFLQKRFGTVKPTLLGVLSSVRGAYQITQQLQIQQPFTSGSTTFNRLGDTTGLLQDPTRLTREAICNQMRVQVASMNGRLEGCRASNLSGNATTTAAVVTVWYTENPGFVKNSSASDLVTRAVNFISANGLNTTRTVETLVALAKPPESINGSSTGGRAPQQSCGDLPRQARAGCILNQMLKGDTESIAALLRIATLMKDFLGIPLPLNTMNSTEMMQGFRALNALTGAYRAGRAAGKPPVTNIDGLLTPELLNATRRDLLTRNVTFNEAALRKVATSVDEILKATPPANIDDPTSGLVELLNVAPPATQRSTTIRFTGETYSDKFKNMSDPATIAFVQRAVANIEEGMRRAGGKLLSFLPTGVANGSIVLQGQTIYESSTNTSSTSSGTNTTDPLDAMLDTVRETGAIGNMTADPANSTAGSFVPCNTSATRRDKVSCFWDLFFARTESLDQIKTLVEQVGPALARDEISKWTSDQLRAASSTLRMSVAACRVLNSTSRTACSPQSFMSDRTVSQMARQMIAFRNGTHDVVTGGTLMNVMVNFLGKYDTLTFQDVLANQRPANISSTSLRLDGTFTTALGDPNSAEFKAQASAIFTQLSSAIAAKGGEVFDMKVTGFKAGSIVADLETTYGSTATAPNDTDPLATAVQDAVDSGTLGNLIVLADANFTNSCPNTTSRCACFWDYWNKVDTPTEFAAISSMLPATDPLSTPPTQAELDIMKDGFEKVVALHRARNARLDASQRVNISRGGFGALLQDTAIVGGATNYFSMMHGLTYDTTKSQKLASALNVFINTSFPTMNLSLPACIDQLPLAKTIPVFMRFNIAFNADFADPQSTAYKDFVKNYTTNFETAVEANGGRLLDLQIIQLRPGSTIVDSTASYDTTTNTTTDPVEVTVSTSATSGALGDMPVTDANATYVTTTSSSVPPTSTTPVSTTTGTTGSTTTGTTGSTTTGTTGSTTTGTTGSTTTGTTGSTTTGTTGSTTTGTTGSTTTGTTGSTTTGTTGSTTTATTGSTTTGTTGTTTTGTTRSTTTGTTGSTTTGTTGSTTTGTTGTTTTGTTGTTTTGITRPTTTGTTGTTTTGTTRPTTTGTTGTTTTGTTRPTTTGTTGTTRPTTTTTRPASVTGGVTGGSSGSSSGGSTSTLTDACTLRIGLDFHRCAFQIFSRINTKDKLLAEIARLANITTTVSGLANTVGKWDDNQTTMAYYSFNQIVIAHQRQKLPEETGTNLTVLEDLWKADLVKAAKQQLASEKNVTFDTDLGKVLATLFNERVKIMYADKQMNATIAINGLRPAAARQASFEINREFKDIYNDLSNPETKLFVSEICKAVTASVDASNGVVVDCIILKLRPGSTIADVKLIYESDQIPADQMGSPPADSVDASITAIKSSGKLGGMPVNASTLVVSSKSNVDRAKEEARILKELEERDRRLLMTVTIPAFIGISFLVCCFLLCTAKLGAWCCGLCCGFCCRHRTKDHKMV